MHALSTKQIRELRAFKKEEDEDGSKRDRADIIIRAAAGVPESEIAEALDSDVRTVAKWIRRYEAHGISGLEDARRTGRRPSITPDQRASIIEARTARDSAGKPPPIDALSQRFNVSRSVVQRILMEAGVMLPRKTSLQQQQRQAKKKREKATQEWLKRVFSVPRSGDKWTV